LAIATSPEASETADVSRVGGFNGAPRSKCAGMVLGIKLSRCAHPHPALSTGELLMERSRLAVASSGQQPDISRAALEPPPITIDPSPKRAIHSCYYPPLKRLSLIASEHIGTQGIRGMPILVCALTLALAIGCCVGGLMVRLRAGKVAVVRRSPHRSQRPTPRRLEEPPVSRS
jgi:hypothetical protein